VVAKVMERLSVNKRTAQEFDMERYNLKKLSVMEAWRLRNSTSLISRNFAALEDLNRA